MIRNKNFRRLQRKKRKNKIKNLIKNIWQEEYNENYSWVNIMIDTPKMCNGLCCKNPRKNKAIDGKGKLTIQELKELEKYKGVKL